MKTIQESQGNMMEIGTIIALLLLLVGVLNYANTIASSIQNRKLTFSVMESVGICTIAPLLSYERLAGNRTIVERLRDYE